MFKKMVLLASLIAVFLCSLSATGFAAVATLKPSLELRQIDSVNVPFQHNRPYPSFERQNGVTYLDLAGTWKYYKLASQASNSQVATTLSRRDGATIGSLESAGYQTVSFNDNGWSNRTLPISENPNGGAEEERVYWFRRRRSDRSEEHTSELQ